MTTARPSPLLRYIRKVAASGNSSQRPDRQLLDDFSARRDEAAFAALVARHGPMVLRVCRRVLNQEQDAEDAFQATFLVLARSTGSIRQRDALAGWLHGVAYRTAMEAKRKAGRRRNHEARLWNSMAKAAVSPSWDDVQAVLDEEIQRLPEAFRSAFVLCVLEAKSGRKAAAELGIKEGTLSSRLTRARQRLQNRLTRRGIKLAALLAALSVAESAGQATASATLAAITIRSGLLVAAGGSAPGVIPSHVAALATGVTRAMFLTKAKIATALLLAVGVVTGAGALMHQVLAAKADAPQSTGKKQSDQTSKPLATAEKTAKPQEPAPKEERPETVRFSGRVLDPDGKPVLGAKLLFLDRWEGLPNKVWAMSGADGGFQFTAHRPLANRGWGMPGENIHVMAAGPGYGFGVARLSKPEAAANLTLRLVKDDVPIRGRVLNLEGRPVSGVRVSVNELDPLNAASLYTPKKGDLTAWLAALKANNRDPWDVERTHLTELYSHAYGLLFPPVMTDVDGRFEMHGIGGERLVSLRLEEPAIATQLVNVMTRASEKICLPLSRYASSGQSITYCGATFEVLMEPTKPVVGVVRDKDTGKPLAGVTITPNKIANPFGIGNFNAGLVRTTTNKEGRYRLVGLPKGEDNQLLATTNDLPYVSASQKVANTPGLEPVTVDFALPRGIWVQGRVTEKTTGKPLAGGVAYYCFRDNPHSKELPFEFGAGGSTGGPNREDGSFRIVALPGRGLIAVQVAHNFRYRCGVGADQIKGPRVKFGDMKCFDTYPFQCQIPNMNTLVEIAPKPGEDSITCDLIVIPEDPGRTLTGMVLGPDDKPLADVQAVGAEVDGTNFTVEGLKPNERRLIQFMHEDKKLAGFLIVQGNDKGPRRVRLEPWGTLTGRIVTAEGEWLTGVRWVRCSTSKVKDGSEVYDFDMTSPLGQEGRFRIEGLTPGLKYELQVSKQGYAVDIISGKSKDLTIKAGETKDLGVVQVKVKE
jgi:RNA polymerase sigma factor (sigma-70 family)